MADRTQSARIPRDTLRRLAALAWRIAAEAGVLATALEENGGRGPRRRRPGRVTGR